MKITYAKLRGYKRFYNSRIAEIEINFQSSVAIITGFNGTGKSSLLQEFKPLPPIRTDYDRNGYKELHITDHGHNYILISDFSNKVSPHSFIRDNAELNTGHTSAVQEELVIKYFGFTPAIRDLVYGKTRMTSLTPVNRKNMFLAINPMDLSLILSVYKEALNGFKVTKAQLQHLYSRKVDLESKMLPDELMNKHQDTKKELTDELLEIDKILYSLRQHTQSIKQQFKQDLEYASRFPDRSQILPHDSIMKLCKNIADDSPKYTKVKRGSEFEKARENLHLKTVELHNRKDTLVNTIKELSSSINEYEEHISSIGEHPVEAIEAELKDIEIELKNYTHLPANPIPEQLWERYLTRLNTIKTELFIFSELDIKIPPVEDIAAKFTEAENLKFECSNLQTKISEIDVSLKELKVDKDKYETQASRIPANCISSTCWFRQEFSHRFDVIKTKYQELEDRRANLETTLKTHQTKLLELGKFLDPFIKNKIMEHYHALMELLNQDTYFRIHDWNTELITRLNNQPLFILKELEELLEGSKAYKRQQELVIRQNELTKELATLHNSTKASLDFIQGKITQMKQEMNFHLTDLTKLDKEITATEATYALYLAYQTDVQTLEKLRVDYSHAERAILVSGALSYWNKLGNKFIEAKITISEQLRELETIIKSQEVLRQTYKDEILVQIDKVAQEKIYYEKICSALSPNSGIPHKSMVKYLNAMITHVNYFINQLWNFKLEQRPISMDQALDYNFPIEIGTELAGDINHLSEGQSEVVNFAWELAILHQMKQLDNIPLYADELGNFLDVTHKQKLLLFLKRLINDKLINQMFLVSHFAAMSGFIDADVICLSTENLPEIPADFNRNVKITRY